MCMGRGFMPFIWMELLKLNDFMFLFVSIFPVIGIIPHLICVCNCICACLIVFNVEQMAPYLSSIIVLSAVYINNTKFVGRQPLQLNPYSKCCSNLWQLLLPLNAIFYIRLMGVSFVFHIMQIGNAGGAASQRNALW